MTAHRSPRLLLAPLLLVLSVLALGAIACTRIASPEGWASPVSSDELLLVAHRDELFALEPQSLDPRWAFPSALSGDDDIDPIALYGTPAIMDSTVFVPAYDQALYALDATSGDLRWQPFETDGPLIGGVTVAEGTVYFGSDDGNVYALDAATGKLRWQPFHTNDGIWSAPTLVGDTLYVTSLDGRLYALDATTGAERWSFSTGAGIASPPVVNEAAGLVYVGGFDSKLRAIDLETHEERWSVEANNWFWNRPLVVEGMLYAGSLDGDVYAVDARTGEPRWARPFETEAPVRAAPVVANGVLIIIDRDGNVYGIDRETGSAVAGTPLALGSDVLADPLVRTGSEPAGEATAEVLVTTTDGDLVRIDPATLQVISRKPLAGD